MDGFSHAAWGYLLWYDSPYTWLAMLACVLPDLISVVPPAAAALVKNKFSWDAAFHAKNLPRWARVYKQITFPVMHSLVVSCVVWGATAIVWSPQWWLLGWPLHVLIDIFTHPREKATPYLWPLKTKEVHGVRWWSKSFLAANTIALIVIGSLVVFR
jgi:hypothetical protein